MSRHGPMVLGICRRMLGDDHAAADAFQAVFLVLAREGPAVRVDDSLGRWLYGVSTRVSRRARAVNRAERARVQAIDGFDPPEAFASTDLQSRRRSASGDRRGDRPVARPVSVGGGALLSGGPHAGAGGAPAPLPGPDRREPAAHAPANGCGRHWLGVGWRPRPGVRDGSPQRTARAELPPALAAMARQAARCRPGRSRRLSPCWQHRR